MARPAVPSSPRASARFPPPSPWASPGWRRAGCRSPGGNSPQDGRHRDWSLGGIAEPSGFVAEHRDGDAAADDIAVLASAAHDVEPTLGASRALLPPFRGCLVITRPGGPPHDLATPGQARDLVRVVVEALHRARREWQPRGTLHLFAAVPPGVAMLLGQTWNTLGPVQTYRHDPIAGSVGVYRSAVLLRPSS
jgi:hypothetical protein